MNPKIRTLTLSAIVGAVYAVLTMLLAPISYGALQFRVSEALCILPFFCPGTAWGLFAGCFIANLMTGNVFDVIFGSAATLAAGLLTAFFGTKAGMRGAKILACLMPVLFNALVVGAVITGAYNGMDIFAHPGVFALNALQVGLGEAGVMFALGLPLMHYLPQKAWFCDYMQKLQNERRSS